MASNHNLGLFKQCEEQMCAIKKLTKENAQLRQENRALRCEINGLYKSIDAKIAAAIEKATLPLYAEISRKNEEISKLTTEVSRLKSIINKDSSNSSKPPSSNGFKAIPNSREKSGKPKGGQKGHPGRRLQLPENMEELEKQGVIERRLVDHTNSGDEYVSKFTIDVEMKVVITEHRFRKGEIPEELYNEVSYGNGIKANALLLMNEGIVAHKRLSDIISGMTHGTVNLSTGTMNKFQSDFCECLSKSGEIDAIKQDLLNGEVMNTDDTSMRVLEKIVYPENSDEPIGYERGDKKSLRATIRTHSNENTTLYTVNPKKDIEGIKRDGILPLFMGTLCHDHESKFYNYGKNNGSCGAHLTRDLKGLSDSYNCSWALIMRKLILDMNARKNHDLKTGKASCAPEKLELFEAEYDRLINQGREEIGQMKEKSWGHNEFNAMLNRLTNFKDSYMLFMRDYKVPFSNNLAERDLRSEKTKEKVSGLFRSWNGIENHTKIRSFISTAKKRGKDLFSAIKQVMENEPVFTN